MLVLMKITSLGATTSTTSVHCVPSLLLLLLLLLLLPGGISRLLGGELFRLYHEREDHADTHRICYEWV